jgi:hypothetical protein
LPVTGSHMVYTSLQSAVANLALCARALQSSRGSASLTIGQYEQVIGIGTAFEWSRRAWLLSEIGFGTSRQQRNARKMGADELCETTLFAYIWIALNAIFARPSLLGILDPASHAARSEIDRFRVVLNAAALSPSEISAAHATLISVLNLTVKADNFPWLPTSTPTVAQVIYYKYTSAEEQNRGVGKRLGLAIAAGNLSTLDLATLIYAYRNWTVHGVTLSSSLRGSKARSKRYVDTINRASTQVLTGAAKKLLLAIDPTATPES